MRRHSDRDIGCRVSEGLPWPSTVDAAKIASTRRIASSGSASSRRIRANSRRRCSSSVPGSASSSSAVSVTRSGGAVGARSGSARSSRAALRCAPPSRAPRSTPPRPRWSTRPPSRRQRPRRRGPRPCHARRAAPPRAPVESAGGGPLDAGDRRAQAGSIGVSVQDISARALRLLLRASIDSGNSGARARPRMRLLRRCCPGTPNEAWREGRPSESSTWCSCRCSFRSRWSSLPASSSPALRQGPRVAPETWKKDPTEPLLPLVVPGRLGEVVDVIDVVRDRLILLLVLLAGSGAGGLAVHAL